MSDRKALRDFYDHVWLEEDGGPENVRRRRFQRTCRTWAYDQLGDLGGLYILEIGPGPGVDTLAFAQQGATVYAADLSRVALRRIRARACHEGIAGRVHLLEMRGEQLALANESVDRIYAETTLMHTDPLLVARESARVLRPGGRAVFVEPLASNPLLMAYRRFSHYRQTQPRYLTSSTFQRMADYFIDYRHREFYLLSVGLSGLDIEGPKVGPLVRLIQQLDSRLCQIAPWLSRWCWMTVVTYQK